MLDKCSSKESFLDKHCDENEEVLNVRHIFLSQSSFMKSFHEGNHGKAKSLSSQLTSTGTKLEQANKKVDALLVAKQREKEALMNAINNQLEKAKIDLECANNYVICIENTKMKSQDTFEHNIKVMLSEHEAILKILRQKFEEAKMFVFYLKGLKKDQELLLKQLSHDREVLHKKMQEFEQNNYIAIRNLKALINEKECLVQKICERDQSWDSLEKKYSKILTHNYDLKTNFIDMKAYLAQVMQKELEKCDIDILLMLVDFVTKMCQAQDILVETEYEMNNLRLSKSAE